MIIDNTIQSLQGIDFTQGHVVIINKELHWTSFDVVNKLRYMIRKTYNISKLKVGHGGTLDPLASGLVVVGVGKETKNLGNYQNEQKEYIAEISFGATTASYDLETSPTGEFQTAHITKQVIEDTLAEKFSGTITQIPPIFSAKSIDGKRAYESARQGIAVAVKPQEVTIYHSQVISYENNTAKISIACSKGTYIRSIAHDLGKELASGAYLSGLIRTKSGGFTLESALTIAEFEALLLQKSHYNVINN